MIELIGDTKDMLQIDKSKWTKVKFGSVAIQQKKSVDREKTDLTFYVKGEHMSSQDLHLREWGELTDEYLGPAFIRYFEEGDILYGSRRTYLRKVSVAPFSGITSNTTFVIKANEKLINRRLLPFIMLSEGFAEHSIKNSKGSVNPYVNWKDLANYEFLLPPKDQQAKLAELLWAMDEVVEREREILGCIGTYTKAYIKEALKNMSKYPQIKLGEVCTPKQWKTIPIKDLTENGYLVYGGNGIIGRYTEYTHKDPVIAISCRGEYCGAVHLTVKESYVTGNSMCLDNLDTRVFIKEYLFYVLFYSNLDSIISGSAQPQIIKSDVERYKVHVLPMKLQLKFVELIDEIWANVSNIRDRMIAAKALQKSLINQIFSVE